MQRLEKQQQNVEQLLNLIKENPDLLKDKEVGVD